VRTGKEKQDVMVRIAVTNNADAPASTALAILPGLSGNTLLENFGYGPFRAPPSRWQQEKLKVADVQGALMVNGRVLLTYRTSAPTPVALLPKLEVVQGESKTPITVKHGLRFELQMKPRETRSIDIVMAGSSKLYPESERNRMAGEDFQKALRKAETDWDRTLEAGMKLNLPEPRLNDIYKRLILSCLQNVPRQPDTPWLLPQHCPSLDGGLVWPWEFAYVLIPLDSLGFHSEMEACLCWFTEHQSGVGKHGADIGPEGEVTSKRGCYVGVGSPRWMNETGSVLWMLAEHYRYTRDAEWLKANRPGILAACEWIRQQRAATRTLDSNGKPVAHFGLLPKGRPHDWEGHFYYFCWTDGYTYKGLAETATAFRTAGAKEAERLSDEAEEYRRCILDTLKQVAVNDPGTGLLYVPNTVYFRRGDPEYVGVWVADGPRVLFDVGILDPVRDVKYWQSLLDMIQRNPGVLGGLMCRFGADGGAVRWDQKSDSPFWYIFSTELYWHRDFLARGELEKSLLVFYNSLVYGVTPDLFETLERVNVADSNYAPLQPNASSNGRVLSMIRRLVIDEQDEARGTLWLLRGCPRRWFAPGKSVSLRDAPTLFGKTALRTACTDRAVTVDVDVPADPALKRLCVAVRHPTRRQPSRVMVNGVTTAIENEIVTVEDPSGHLQITAEYD
jgi:hypothetical protein